MRISKLLKYGIVLSTLLFGSAVAAASFYPFQSLKKQQQFQYLVTHMRCLVCQDESLAASNAMLAVQLRGKIYAQVKQGKTSQQIVHSLTAKYTDFILFAPPFNPTTYVLWVGPFLLLLVGVFVVWRLVRRGK